MLRKQEGFTLIELLIVIVIIGILAGVLIAVIDPTSQQNRARDAGIEASINKVVLATEGYVSAYGAIPSDLQFINQFKTGTITASGTTCDQTSGNPDCYFAVSGTPLSQTCPGGTPRWYGSSAPAAGNQCWFRYTGTVNTGNFEIYAKSSGIYDVVFKYQNSGTNAGVIQKCPANDPVAC